MLSSLPSILPSKEGGGGVLNGKVKLTPLTCSFVPDLDFLNVNLKSKLECLSGNSQGVQTSNM